jgi:hypothetical protein
LISIAKRTFLAWLASLFSAPAIAHVENIMPAKIPASDLTPPPPKGPKAVLRLSGLIDAERQAQADLRWVLDYTNEQPGGFEIYGHVRIAGFDERDTG